MKPDCQSPYSETKRLGAKHVELLYRQAPVVLLGTLGCLVLVGYTLEGEVNDLWLALWTLLSLVLSALRAGLVIAYRRVDPPLERQIAWGRWFVGGVLANGLLWGAAGVLLFPQSLPLQVFLILVLAGLAAASSVTYAAVASANYAFIAPAIFPVVVQNVLIGDPSHLTMAVLTALFALVLVASAARMRQSMTSSLRLAMENTDLLAEMRAAKERAEALNAGLKAEVLDRRHAERSLRLAKEQLTNAQRIAGFGNWEWDIVHNRLEWSEQVYRIFGLEPRQFAGSYEAFELCVHPDDRQRVNKALKNALEHRESYSVEHRIVRSDGIVRYVQEEAEVTFNAASVPVHMSGVVHDVTERVKAEQALFQEKERVVVTLQSIGDGVITTDVQGNIDYVNPVAERLIGRPHRGVVGYHYLDVLRLTDEATGESLEDLVWLCLRQEGTVVQVNNGLLTDVDGREYTIKISAAPMRNSEGRMVGAVLALHDITEVMHMTRQMNYQATHDVLTGLVNRREFESRLERAIYEVNEKGVSHALFYMDLDQFKVVNDTCGHQAGDELLRQLAMLLSGQNRDSDTLARLGGDEFAVLLENCPLDKAREIAERMRRTVKEFRFVWQDKPFEIGVSIGVVPIQRGAHMADLLSAADAACYCAKDLGRNRIFVYKAEGGAAMRHHSEMAWVHRITDAFESGRFVLYSQAIAPLQDSPEIDGHYEILVRMLDGDGKPVPPGAFIPAAERYNLMPTLDRWVIRTTLQMLGAAQGNNSRPPIVCSINLSGQSLCDDHLLGYVNQQFEESGVPYASICFEITETAAITNLTRAMGFIAELKRKGCYFSLDDFGSGLSSFGYLKNLPVDYLKIDGGFIKDMLDDPIDRAMVEAINQVGHVMGLGTIAEFVETAEVADLLREMGVDFAQGYGIALPESLEGVLKRVAAVGLPERLSSW